MPVSLRLHHDGVSGMKNLFDQKVKSHSDRQKACVFSAEWDGTKPARISRDDANYGRPDPGSKSAARAQAAQLNIMMEIRYLCDVIYDCADHRSPDGRAAITFGRLFNIYITISDKLVGTLLRARKHGFVHFEGEMLFQRQDDHKVIELARNINTIRAKFGQKALVTGGGTVEPWDKDGGDEATAPQGPITRRNSNPTGNSGSSFRAAQIADVKPKIPKMFSRSQSLDDLGSIVFVSGAASEEELVGAESLSEGSQQEAGQYLKVNDNPPTGEKVPGDVAEGKISGTSTIGDKCASPRGGTKMRMALSPGRMATRERSRSRAASPAPSMGTIDEDREAPMSNSEDSEALIPLETPSKIDDGETLFNAPTKNKPAAVVVCPDTPYEDSLNETTQLLNRVTLQLSNSDSVGVSHQRTSESTSPVRLMVMPEAPSITVDHF